MFDLVGQSGKTGEPFLICRLCETCATPAGNGRWAAADCAVLGGHSRASSRDGVDESWRVEENRLESSFTVTARLRYASNRQPSFDRLLGTGHQSSG